MENSKPGFFVSLLEGLPQEWQIVILVVIIAAVLLLVILFRRELGGLIQRITDIGYDKSKGFTIRLGENVKQAQQQVSGNPQLTQGGGAGATRPTETIPPALSARDLMLESWGSLKQVIYDAVVARRIQLTPATRTPEAVDRLLSANVIAADRAEHMKLLYEIGKQVADSAGTPNRKDAATYHELVYRVLDWMMSNAFFPQVSGPVPTPQRKTQVGGSFLPPAVGQAAVTLLGVAGPLKGRQFHVDKEVFRIGSSSENDLKISGDSYVSSTHAHIRYEKGGLWLADLHSRNGTFLNGNRLKDTPSILKIGDRIQVGNSSFEVTQASAG